MNSIYPLGYMLHPEIVTHFGENNTLNLLSTYPRVRILIFFSFL